MGYINRLKINSYIMALFIFQFGFMQPIASIVNSQIPVAGFSLLLLFAMVLNNRFRIKPYVVIVYIIISIYFFLNAIIYKYSALVIVPIYGEFLFKSFSAFIIGSMSVSGEDLYDAFLKIAFVNFIAIALYPFVSFMDSMNYMRFGYAMTPSVIMFFYAATSGKHLKPIWVLLTSISFILTVVYGSRGPIVIFIIFALLLLIFSKKITKIKKLAILTVTCISALITLQYQLLAKLLDYLFLDIGIKSYSLVKLRKMVSEGLAASSSGRDKIYGYIIDLIKEKPISGYGIGFTQMNIDSTAHNIFLQILIESGIFGLILWSIIWIYCFRKYVRLSTAKEMGIFEVTTLLGAVSAGRLLVSSDMWLRPEYWFVLSLIIGYSYKKYKRCKE